MSLMFELGSFERCRWALTYYGENCGVHCAAAGLSRSGRLGELYASPAEVTADAVAGKSWARSVGRRGARPTIAKARIVNAT